MSELIGILAIPVLIFLAVLVMLWCLVPFLVLGISKRMDKTNELIEAANHQTAKTNSLLTEIRDNSAWVANDVIERQQEKIDGAAQ